MAAGKSTVREIIGKDVFWSKASPFHLFSRLLNFVSRAQGWGAEANFFNALRTWRWLSEP